MLSTAYRLPQNLRSTLKHQVPRNPPTQDAHLVAAGLLEAHICAVEVETGYPVVMKWLELLFLPLARMVYTDPGGKGKLHIDSKDQYIILKTLDQITKAF